MLIALLAAAPPCHAQFTGHTVACDRRYPTDTKVPSKYGQQVIAAKGSYFLAGPCGIKVTGTQITISLSALYNKYAFKNSAYNGYRLTVLDTNVKSRSLRDDVLDGLSAGKQSWRGAEGVLYVKSRSFATRPHLMGIPLALDDGTWDLRARSKYCCGTKEALKAKSRSLATRPHLMGIPLARDAGVGALQVAGETQGSGTITSVTIDAATNISGFDASRITYQSTYVQVNLAGLTFGLKDRVVLDVGF